MKSKKEHWTTVVSRIATEQGCSAKEARAIYKAGKNGAVEKPATSLKPSLNGLNADAIGREVEVRIEFLSATISGIRQQLEAYQEELGQLVGVAKALGLELSEQAEQAVGIVTKL